jgi:hypothetical protein
MEAHMKIVAHDISLYRDITKLKGQHLKHIKTFYKYFIDFSDEYMHVSYVGIFHFNFLISKTYGHSSQQSNKYLMKLKTKLYYLCKS